MTPIPATRHAAAEWEALAWEPGDYKNPLFVDAITDEADNR